MKSCIITLGLLVAAVLSAAALVPEFSAARLPGNDQGYEPQQPIAFSHRLHAGELQIDCQYCHSGSDKSRHAGIPAAQTCMNCHKFVTAPFGAVRAEDELAAQEGRSPRRIVSPEIRKIYDALALDDNLQPDPRRTPQPVAWAKVHNLPDFVYFDHRAHVQVGVACQQCHGPVETMERVRQVETLSMGWCVNCHRQAGASGVNGVSVQPSTDCAACHY